MHGFPKHLNNRQDYEFVRRNFKSDEWMPEWQKLLDNRFIWKDAAVLRQSDEGVSDATRRVVERRGSPEPDSTPVRVQQELVENENALIFRLGFSVSEVLDAIAGNGN